MPSPSPARALSTPASSAPPMTPQAPTPPLWVGCLYVAGGWLCVPQPRSSSVCCQFIASRGNQFVLVVRCLLHGPYAPMTRLAVGIQGKMPAMKLTSAQLASWAAITRTLRLRTG